MIELFKYDNQYKEQGLVAGIDEAGRGPLAGPVVCAAVIMPLEEDRIIEGINDSKQLTQKQREILYDKIINRAVSFSVSIIDRETIDKVNILNATKIGMKNALKGLKTKPHIVLIDAVKLDIETKQVNINHGDRISYNIAAASILAKVTRDRIMIEYSKKYPQYEFEKHKGYPTKLHYEKLRQFGKCELHRESYKLIKG